MHHRRKRLTSKRENKRLETKSARQNERRALTGDKASGGRTLSWHKAPLLREANQPLLDAPSNGKNRSKRKRPKKEKCPVNRTHEWYPELFVREEDYRSVYGFRGTYSFTYREELTTKTCIHCWKEKVIKRRILWNRC